MGKNIKTPFVVMPSAENGLKKATILLSGNLTLAEIPELKLGVYYQFKAKLSSRTIRERLQNPFALQVDDSFAPIEYIPVPKEFVLRRYEIAENTHFANNQQLAKALNSIQREINKSPETFIFELLKCE